MDEDLIWLQELADTSGISGYESKIKQMLIERLSGVATVSYDRLGSVIFTKNGTAELPKIMLASHMDEVGFMVKTITKEGFLRFTTIGGWWEHVMLGQRVVVHTVKGDIHGVIGSKAPHVLGPEERKKMVDKKDMFIDICAKDAQEAKEDFGVCPGDPISPYAKFTVMANPKMLMAKAWDDRIGCAVMTEALKRLSKGKHPNSVYGVGTVQEEVGLRGAQTSAHVIHPDVALIIDTCVAGDTPGITEEMASGKLGQGIGISIYDASMLSFRALRDFAISIAKANDIPFQFVFSEGGGTDAGRIHLHQQGVPSLVLSIPTRYIHSHNSIIHLDDYEAAVRLVVKMCEVIDKNKYEELIKG